MLQLPDLTLYRSAVPYCFDYITGTSFALGSDHGGALGDSPQSLSEISAATHKRSVELVLVDMMSLVG